MKRDYREKDVSGLVTDGHKMAPAKVTVRMTNDGTWKTLSLCAGNVMIMIPLESVEDIIEVVKK